jgi:hypothetical protein
MKALQGTRVQLGALTQAVATTPRTALIDAVNASSCKLLVGVLATQSTADPVTISVYTGANGTSTTDYTLVGTSAASATVAGIHVVDIDMRGKDRYIYTSVAPGTAGTTDQVVVSSIVGVMEVGIAPSNSTTQFNNAVL